jgi:uncharacterized SAM-binding protein YcdF (DUF218 family)
MRLRLALVFVFAVFLAIRSGSYLIVDEPRKSDIILVLAGETERRPTRAQELLREGYGRKLILDVPVKPQFYGSSQPELAQKYIASLPDSGQMSVCPITGLSTKEEAQNAASCLSSSGGHSVLIVTSDFHTRRALNIFRHELPSFEFSVAAVNDPRQFGLKWWTNRQWAKVNFEEWTRLTWWQVVDRWK